jgi:hypothetical protein
MLIRSSSRMTTPWYVRAFAGTEMAGDIDVVGGRRTVSGPQAHGELATVLTYPFDIRCRNGRPEAPAGSGSSTRRRVIMLTAYDDRQFVVEAVRRARGCVLGRPATRST